MNRNFRHAQLVREQVQQMLLALDYDHLAIYLQGESTLFIRLKGAPPFCNQVIIEACTDLRNVALKVTTYVDEKSNTETQEFGPFKGRGWAKAMSDKIVELSQEHGDPPGKRTAIKDLDGKLVMMMFALLHDHGVALPVLERVVRDARNGLPQRGQRLPEDLSMMCSKELASQLIKAWEAGPARLGYCGYGYAGTRS